MDERSLTFHIGPIWFDGTVCIMVLLTCLIVFFLAYFFTRNLKLKPTGKQNAIEWVIDFSRGIVTDNLPRKELSNFHLLAFTLFLFVFVANNIGLGIYNDLTYSLIRGEKVRLQRIFRKFVLETL